MILICSSVLFLASAFINWDNFVGKIFLRGKGIKDKKLTRFGCYAAENKANVEGFWEFDSVFSDPRLSQIQRKRLIVDFFDTSMEICPMGEQWVHSGDKTSGFTKILTVPWLMGNGKKYIDQEMVEIILNSIQNIHSEEIIWNKYSNLLKPYFDALLWLFNSDKLGKECFWINFNILSKTLDASPDCDKILEDTNTKEVFLRILGNPLVTSLDIKNLCHSPYSSIRHIAVEHHLSSKENKIIVALMDGRI